MSSYRLKTKYTVEGPYGSREEKTLYAHVHNTVDRILFYDEEGNFLFVVEDVEDNNMFDAINRLMYAWEEGGRGLREGVQHMEPHEFKFIGQ